MKLCLPCLHQIISSRIIVYFTLKSYRTSSFFSTAPFIRIKGQINKVVPLLI